LSGAPYAIAWFSVFEVEISFTAGTFGMANNSAPLQVAASKREASFIVSFFVKEA